MSRRRMSKEDRELRALVNRCKKSAAAHRGARVHRVSFNNDEVVDLVIVLAQAWRWRLINRETAQALAIRIRGEESPWLRSLFTPTSGTGDATSANAKDSAAGSSQLEHSTASESSSTTATAPSPTAAPSGE